MVGCTTLLVVLSTFVIGAWSQGHDQHVVCYLGSWAVYRPGAGKFNIENIQPQLCTSLVYAFAGLDANTYTMKSLDPEYDINKKAMERFVGLKSQNPKLKVLVAIGGWTEGSSKYSIMSRTASSRRNFITSAVDFIQTHGFDGLDLDWEYPANRGGAPEDKENFVLLVKELRQEFVKHGWMLTAATAAGKSIIDNAYDIENLVDNLDFIHVMAYDYHGKWDGHTGHNAPLYARDDEPDAEKSLNVEATIKTYLEAGAPAHKLVLGLGFYGRTFLLSDASKPGITAPAQASAFAGPYTREDGFLGYNEICEKQTTEGGLWNIVWQKAHQAPYMYRDNMWVGYDDPISLNLKVAYAQNLGLGGVMIWSIDTDDFTGACSRTRQRYPLLMAINKALNTHKDKRPSAVPQPPRKPGIDIDTDMGHDIDHHDDQDVHVDQDVHHDDHDDHDVHDVGQDVSNDIDNDIDNRRTSPVGGDPAGAGSAAITPTFTILLSLLLASVAAQ